MTELIGPLNSGAAVGSAGSALSNQDSPAIIAGRVQAVYVKYNPAYPANPPDTAKVIIATKGTNNAAPSLTILTLDGANTDGWFLVRKAICDPTGSAVANLYDEMPIYDLVNVSIDLVDTGHNVDVWLLVSG